MGNLLRLLSREESPKYDFFVDFEHAEPTESEMEVYLMLQELLEEADKVILKLQTFRGAENEIREAISNPRNELLQSKAWKAVVPSVVKLREFFDFSRSLEATVPILFNVLCAGSMTPHEHLKTQQALVKQFAKVIDFVLKFDDLKMSQPSIQNDFSYYRRTLSRFSKQDEVPSINLHEIEISVEDANVMSLFYAHPTPMLRMFSDATSRFVAQNKGLPVTNTNETLCTMAIVCQKMLENLEFRSRFKKNDTVLFIHRVMVGLIILYDHVHPVGAFVKSCQIDIKGSVRMLKEQECSENTNLLNALRFTTKHLNDDSTPKQVKMLLTC
ncbi:hypothetical protein HDE_12399 [Halotydeus destructor]|nr:hypothetical protein HDE_12399 [Halotydeus destructor]